MSNIRVLRIAKAKRKDGQLQVELEDTDSDTERRTSLKSLGGCHVDLDAAFDALARYVREILEWPSNLYSNHMTVTGVSWSVSEKTDVEGAVISAQASLEDCNSPFCFNTPFLPFELYNEENESQPVMPDGAQDALRELRAEVLAYIEGKRAQGDLFNRVEERYGIPADVVRENLSGPYAVAERKDYGIEALAQQSAEVVNAILEKHVGRMA